MTRPLEIVGEAEDGAQLVRLAATHRPESSPLTSVLEDEVVVGAVRAGAMGYVLKDTHGVELKEAMHAAADGRVHLSGRRHA